MLEYSIRVSYDPERRKASYTTDIEDIRRLTSEECAAALSVMFGAAFELLCKYKSLPKRFAFEKLVYYAGLEDLRRRKVSKERR